MFVYKAVLDGLDYKQSSYLPLIGVQSSSGISRQQ